jgi:DNA modification methylase
VIASRGRYRKMEALKLLGELKDSNVKLWAEGGKLKYDAPRGTMSQELISRMRANKEAILAFLQNKTPDTYPRDEEAAREVKSPLLLLTQGEYTPPLLLPQHCSDISAFLDKIILGDCLEKLKGIPDNSVDLVVTDPPYGLKFMGKDWDKAVPPVDVWIECLRVMKPGALAFVMCGTRQDCLARMISNLDKAGFKLDFTSLYWTYAQGFPKARNIAKILAKRAYKEDTKSFAVHSKKKPQVPCIDGSGRKVIDYLKGVSVEDAEGFGGIALGVVGVKQRACWVPIYETKSPFAGAYGGFQCKPAVEVIIVAMKPMDEKTYVGQALKNGKGITWMDECRIPYKDSSDKSNYDKCCEVNGKYETGLTWGGKKVLDIPRAGERTKDFFGEGGQKEPWNASDEGRFPANILVSDDVLDDGKERTQGHWSKAKTTGFGNFGGGKSQYYGVGEKHTPRNFSRFFSLDAWAEKNLPFLIVPKASKKEKNAGCEDENPEWEKTKQHNFHPTVKPIKLLSYLITMGSREGEVVLDPFAGSGSTCVAAKKLNRKFIGIEINPLYHEVALNRLSNFEKSDQSQKRCGTGNRPKADKKMTALPKIVKRGKGDYPRVYRPRRISEVYGQENTKQTIAHGLDNGNLPQVLLFHGVSGAGKTTIARIIAMGLNCEKGPTSEPCCECEHCRQVFRGSSFGFQEIDAGRFSGVDDLRKLLQNLAAGALGHDNKIILFDECQRLSKEAQHVLLKPTEDVYPQTYFIFCTTDPEKVIETLRNRCMPFEFKPIQDEILRQLLIGVCDCEGLEHSSIAIDSIIKEAQGRPRNALTLLQKAVGCGTFKSLFEVAA